DVGIVDGDATRGPVDFRDIEVRRVGAMNSDLAAFMRARRDQVCSEALLKPLVILLVGVIYTQEPFEARTAVLAHNQIITLGGAAIAFGEFSACSRAPTKNRVVGPIKMTFEIDFEPMTGLVCMYHPVKRVFVG